ncbi:MAG: AmmeMemoRadiSam system protein A [Desulfobacteraceae bacterium]|nr:AmmeMemoRadiSam system protein A [Desulfobacteraceae bacterium]
MADSMVQLTREQGQVLVRLARRTLEARLGATPPGAEQEALTSALQEELLRENRGTFVCLKSGGELRGCIGSLVGDAPLAEGVRRNAVNAAFQDHRFLPLGAGELGRVRIEVSVLTPPQPLAFADGADLIAKLRPHVDGVIIRKGLAGATFLPQVWEQLPQADSFLAHLCRKAGLPPDTWRYPGLEVMTYQVQAFSEEEGGD